MTTLETVDLSNTELHELIMDATTELIRRESKRGEYTAQLADKPAPKYNGSMPTISGNVYIKKSNNQQRYETIEKARKFVIDHERDLPGKDVRGYGNEACQGSYYETDFHIKNRKVTAVVHLVNSSRVRLARLERLVGRAFCMPGDVFNSDTGKAIALARALEIEIPEEFLKAIQPDEVVVGMKVAYPDELSRGIMTVIDYSKDRNYPPNETKLSVAKDINTRIIDDSKAEYGDSHE